MGDHHLPSIFVLHLCFRWPHAHQPKSSLLVAIVSHSAKGNLSLPFACRVFEDTSIDGLQPQLFQPIKDSLRSLYAPHFDASFGA